MYRLIVHTHDGHVTTLGITTPTTEEHAKETAQRILNMDHIARVVLVDEILIWQGVSNAVSNHQEL